MTEKDNNPGYSVMLNHKRTITEESFNKILGLSAHTNTICKWCSKPVAHQASRDSYIHLDSNGIPIPLGRGCRSASYDESAPYEGCLQDQTLKKHWRATPRKKKKSSSEILEEATGKIISEHKLKQHKHKSNVTAFSWSLGDDISYEEGLRDLVKHAIVIAQENPTW